ncbi:MAG: fibronectin type III domain-containing protein [Acidobacteria bacterium]|nr:fibronectin type III domain-containing protein [Acidobacteriota bacterium]
MIRVRTLAVAALSAAIAGAACGKKGPPLAPIVRIPNPVGQISAERLGRDVYVTLTVPATNIDRSMPADVARIEVFAYTGRNPPLPARFTELGTIVATFPVAPSPLPGQPVPAASTATPSPADAEQGVPVTILDTLDADELVQGALPAVDPRRPPVLVGALGGATTGPLRRFYMAIPFSQRGRPGPPGAVAEVTLITLPAPPVIMNVSYTAAAVSLTWEPAGGPLGFLLDRPLPPEPLPFPEPLVTGLAAPAAIDSTVPPGPTRYSIYRELAPDPFALPAPADAPPPRAAVPMPLTPDPQNVTTLADTVEFGRQRCYTVRAIRGTGPRLVVSEPSAPACITPIDIFSPVAPAGLATVASEGGISLIWEPNGDADLGGYLVLRREGGDATLRQLTDAPIADARFVDTAVTPGTRYTYAVVAVDTQLPLPNVSAESERVEETAR